MRTAKNDMEEASGGECEESRVKDRRSRRSNEMEDGCESDCKGDAVNLATFNNEKTGMKLDRKRRNSKCSRHPRALQFSPKCFHTNSHTFKGAAKIFE